jgi:hypothetical protein
MKYPLGGSMKKGKIDLNEFKQIKVISSGYTRPGAQSAEDEVNALLGEGWELVETYTTCYSNSPPLSSQQEVHFVVGRRQTIQKSQPLTVGRPA